MSTCRRILTCRFAASSPVTITPSEMQITRRSAATAPSGEGEDQGDGEEGGAGHTLVALVSLCENCCNVVSPLGV